ncbi:hypothetical protein ACFL1G_02560 [Planctomycetota bacterium]
MSKTRIFWFWILLTGTAIAAEPGETQLFSDGFLLSGIEGKFILDDSNDVYFFESASDINDYFGRFPAGSALQMLPSATLEEILADAEQRTRPAYKLWGKVTRYKNQNFIYPQYFFPLSRVQEPDAGTQTTQEQLPKPEVAINEQGDAIVIPKEIMDKIADRKIIRTERISKRLDKQVDTVIANRTAVLKKQSDGNSVFVFDSLGRNVTQASLKTLPSSALELAELKQKASPEPLRFRISGLLTKYKGDYYLLLQGANITYNHQNFSR